MAVVALIPEGDLELVNGQFVMVEGSAMVRQLIQSRFRFFLADWFLDLREGVPYYRDVLVKNPDIGVIRSIFRSVLVDTPGVLEVLKFSLAFDAETRSLSFDFEALSTDGPIAVSPDDTTFIVRV